MLANFKCCKCAYKYKSQPGPTQCPRCDNLYVEWTNYEEWKKATSRPTKGLGKPCDTLEICRPDCEFHKYNGPHAEKSVCPLLPEEENGVPSSRVSEEEKGHADGSKKTI